MAVDEYTPLRPSLNSGHHGHYILYSRRWYILLVFGLLSATQSNLWITYGAVAETTMEMYDADSADVNFLTATGPIGFIPLTFLTSWAITEYGLRVTSLAGAFLCAAGAIIRCFATPNSFWIVITAQLLNAASGPVVMNSPPALSATWFGVNERTFATAVGTIANSVGSACGFLLGLWVQNETQLRYLLYGEAAFAVVLLVLIFAYFPKEPPTPPSATSSMKIEQPSLWKSFRETMRESAAVFGIRDGVLVLLAAGLSAGAVGGWSSMLVILLAPYYSQWDIQWLGFFNIIGSVVGGLAIGKLHDHFRHFKVMMCLSFLLGAIVFVGFSLATEQVFICTFLEIMALNVLAGMALGATGPVSYEALVEVTYPVKEEVSAGLLSLVNNFGCLILLIVGDYKTGNFINWMMAGLCFCCFVLVLIMRETYKRTNIDLKNNK